MHGIKRIGIRPNTPYLVSSSIHKTIYAQHNPTIIKSTNFDRLTNQTLISASNHKPLIRHFSFQRRRTSNTEYTGNPSDKYVYSFQQETTPTENFSSIYNWTPPPKILTQRSFANKGHHEPVALDEFSQVLNQMLPPSPTGIATSCSGGSDSMALTLLANDYCKNKQIPFIALIVDHKLRENSTEEANYVKSMLAERGISSEILTVHWESKPTARVQDLSRTARYQLVNQRCKELRIPFVLTGHHMEDQVETLIMRIAMQTGTEGLTGVTPFKHYDKDIAIVRPLLCFSKSQLRATCESYQQKWVEDPSNRLETYFRNRVRKTLEEEVYPKIPMDTFVSFIYDMKEVRYLYSQRVIEFCKAFLRLNTYFGFCSIPLAQVQRLDIAYASRFLLRLIRFFTGTFSASHIHLFEAILRQLRNPPQGSKFSCSGILIIPRGESLFICKEKLHNPKIPIESGQTVRLGLFEVTYWMVPSKIAGTAHPMTNRKAFVKRMEDREWKQLVTLHPNAGNEYKHLPYDVRTNVPILVDEKGNLLATPHFRYFADGVSLVFKFKPTFDLFSDDENLKQMAVPNKDNQK